MLRSLSSSFLSASVVVAVHLLSAPNVRSEDVNGVVLEARERYEQRDLEALQPKITELELLADGGNPDARLLLGDIFSSELYSENPMRTGDAISRYEQALQAGQPIAGLRLGDIYAKGALVAKDLTKAFAFYQQAAPKNRTAKRRLAEAYLDGEGADKDTNQAVTLLGELSAQGDRQATRTLARLYETGEGVDADRERARSYFEKSLSLGDTGAAAALGDIVSASSSTDSARRAFDYYLRGSQAGDAGSTRKLAQCYLTGTGTAANAEMGFHLLKGLAESGDKRSFSPLAQLYASGKGTSKDGTKATHYFTLAGEVGDAWAIVHLSDLYYFGRGVQKDPQRAISLLADAVSEGNGPAARRLIALYREAPGKAIARSPAKARAVFETIKARLDPDIRQQEEILFSAMDARGTAEFSQMSRGFAALPERLLKPTLLTMRRLNPNAYVYLVQDHLKQAGLYSGSLSGTLTADTAVAINKLCRKSRDSATCGKGPMSAVVGAVLAEAMQNAA